ncbi:MAG TPA: tetratricopeptide repeat protein [Candidatus Acidoferrales bacterium]|nr:tetratricopeptide repeat protein [Candidatus Acidoferrales bacterium]
MPCKLGIACGVLLLAGAGLTAPRAGAQNIAGVSGTVTDPQGKPLADFVIVLKSDDMGTTYNLKTDGKGVFRQIGLRPGMYSITLKPKDKDQAIVENVACAINAQTDNVCDVDLKKIMAHLTAEEEAARKKQEDEQKKFENMKAAFMAGQAKVEEADKARGDMQKAPADQRAALQPKVNGLYQEALQSFEQAQRTAPDKDPNLHLVYEKLGYSNEMLGNYDAAVADYQKAIELKPTVADYYTNLAMALARTGKVPDAMQTCEKEATVDATKSQGCWLNVGIVLYNKNDLADAVPALQKATTLNPKNPQGWYLLGASLVATMTVKQEGEKMIPVLAPGTVEAYQKCIELDPNGPWGSQAKAGLEQLKAMGAGVDTKIKVKKGKG